MSDTILALISSLSGFIGVLIGSYITIKQLKHDRSDKYLLAALEIKLKAHQEAYNLSWDLPSSAHKSSRGNEHLKNCEKWYRENCLYREPEARAAFYNAYRTAMFYYLYYDEWKTTKDSTKLEEKWHNINIVRHVIEKNVTVPLILPEDLRKEEYDYKGKI